MYIRKGTYYWYPPTKEAQRLGKTAIRLGQKYEESMIKWTELVNGIVGENEYRMGDLMDRYMAQIAPKKAPKSYKDNLSQIKPLREFFGNHRPVDITPVLVYEYIDKRGENTPIAANREKALLSHMLSYGVRWGVVDRNVCRDVKNHPERKRDRYVNDDEYQAVWATGSETVRNMMDMAYITALRKADILAIRFQDVQPEGLLVAIGKTRRQGSPPKKMLFQWTDELHDVVNTAKKSSAKVRGMNLICTRKGQQYTTSGFDSIWKRTIKRAIREGSLEEPFRFHDIRRKAATDADSKHGREFSRQLLGHTTQTMTAHYVSGITRATPLK